MSEIYTHAYYKELFMQLLQREELGFAADEQAITLKLCSRQVDEVETRVFLRGRLLTFSCRQLARVQDLPATYKLLNELNRGYPDIKFSLADGSVCMTLQSFILKERMVCQCLLILRRLADVLDRVYPQLKRALLAA